MVIMGGSLEHRRCCLVLSTGRGTVVGCPGLREVTVPTAPQSYLVSPGIYGSCGL